MQRTLDIKSILFHSDTYSMADFAATRAHPLSFIDASLSVLVWYLNIGLTGMVINLV